MSLLLFLAFEAAVAEPPPVEPPAPAHSFDTGLSKPQRTIIREAIVARLAPLQRDQGGYLQAVIELPEMMRDSRNDDDRAMLYHFLNGRAPGVGVALGRRANRSGLLATEAEGTLEIGVYAASKHGSDYVKGRLSANGVALADVTKDPGIEIILEHVEQLLQGFQPAGTMGPLRGTDEDSAGTAADLTVWEQKYEVSVDRTINPDRAIEQLATELLAKHTEDRNAALEPGTYRLAPLETLTAISPPEES